MKQVTITETDGTKYKALIPEQVEELQQSIKEDRRKNIREHLYIGFLLVGIIASTLGIYLSLRKIKK